MTRPRGYITYRPQRKTRELLAQVNEIFATYRAELPLTIRQVFYRLVGAYGYPKDEKAYGRLQEHLARFRRAGFVPFEYIRDDGIASSAPLELADAVPMLEEVAEWGQNSRLSGQPRWLELWCEAGGMKPQLERVAAEYGVPVYSGGGYDSLTGKWEASQRAVARQVPTAVLHVGDLDKHGKFIYRAADEGVSALAERDVEFIRVAVTPEQVGRYGLPTKPRTKPGEEKVQAEALAPDVLADEVRRALESELDLDALERAKDAEPALREAIGRMARRLREEAG